MATEYTSGEGNSTPTDKAFYKLYRGEDLSKDEWKLVREARASGEIPEELKTYDTAPF